MKPEARPDKTALAGAVVSKAAVAFRRNSAERHCYALTIQPIPRE